MYFFRFILFFFINRCFSFNDQKIFNYPFMFQSLFETCIFIILYFLCFYSFLCFRYALSSSRVQSMYLLSFFFFFLSLIVIYYEGSKNAFYISFALLPCLVTTLPRKQFLINFFICFYSRWALWRNGVKLMQRQQ